MSSSSHDKLQRGSSAEVIARHIETAIESGDYQHQEQLPSTRTLATEWHTSVATITRAMQLLNDRGLVISRDRSSRIVNNPPVLPESLTLAPSWVVIGGYAGSGKTEFGRILARLTHWPVFDKDSATRPMLEAALRIQGMSVNDRESETYLAFRKAEYDGLYAQVLENLQCGNSAIMTAPFLRELRDPTWTAQLRADAFRLNAQLHVVWIYCNPESMQSYLEHRGAGRDAYKLEHWDEYVSSIDLNFTPSMPYEKLNNSRGAPPLIEQARKTLASWNNNSADIEGR